jgi:pimeloyl-ACP methyl ester carboxylesterase
VLHDHLGFGLSEKPADYSYSFLEQAELAIGLWTKLGIKRGHVIAHDYGTTVASELVALRERGLLPLNLLSITMSNGSVLVELAQLRLAQRILRNQTFGPYLARMSNLGFFKKQIRRILAKPENVTDAELEALFEALISDDGRERLSPISQYLDERVRFRERWFGALVRTDLRTHLLWGKKDPIAVPAIPEKLHASMKSAKLTWIDDLGHYPMLEDAERWATLLLEGIELNERESAEDHKP